MFRPFRVVSLCAAAVALLTLEGCKSGNIYSDVYSPRRVRYTPPAAPGPVTSEAQQAVEDAARTSTPPAQTPPPPTDMMGVPPAPMPTDGAGAPPPAAIPGMDSMGMGMTPGM